MAKCGQKCEVYSRVVGYYRPVDDWNIGKREEFKDRLTFDPAITAPADVRMMERLKNNTEKGTENE